MTLSVSPPAPLTATAPGKGEPTQGQPSSRWRPKFRLGPTTAWLAVIVVVGAALRLVNFDALGLNSDEVVYAGQSASLAGNTVYADLFPIFRAHPMLIQSLLSVVYAEGEHDTVGRVVIGLIGVATLLVVFVLGCELYGRRAGLLAAALLAVMPYHVIVTRQILLDGPMVLFATLTLLCLAKFGRTHQITWMIAAGGAMGLTMLAKESSVVLLAGGYAFLALSPSIRRPIIGALGAVAIVVSVFLVHPITQVLAGAPSAAGSYLVWQLLRRPNHDWWFYPATVPWAIGPLVLLAAAVGVWLARRESSGRWREILLCAWIAVPVVMFELWPVKGYQYLLPAAPAVALLAARGLLQLPIPQGRLRLALPGLARRRTGRTTPRKSVDLHVTIAPRGRLALRAAVIGVVLGSSLAVSVPQVTAVNRTEFLAGTGGVPGGRETGQWIGANTPAGAVVMTLGPSMANIIMYYGRRRAYGLSVSPNPLHRNPAYKPIINPDKQMRQGDLQYVVWDAYSANRSPYFSDYLVRLADRYHGRVVHTETVPGQDDAGRPVEVPVIKVYEVRP